MLNYECILSYRNQYNTHSCGIEEPGNRVLISDENDQTVIEPYEGETDETFIDRLERSKKAGRNLFFEEWESFEYEKDCCY